MCQLSSHIKAIRHHSYRTDLDGIHYSRTAIFHFTVTLLFLHIEGTRYKKNYMHETRASSKNLDGMSYKALHCVYRDDYHVQISSTL